MVSSNKAGFNLRENEPLSRNTLHTPQEFTRQRTNPTALCYPMGYRSRSLTHTGSKVEAGHLIYPVSVRDTAKSRMGCRDNCHLNYLVEFIIVNVGGLQRNAKASSSANVRCQRRSGHSSPRLGKPATWRRAAVCWDFLSKRNRMLTRMKFL
jgi:hypothetical protein